jgi:dihydrofolate reductase
MRKVILLMHVSLDGFVAGPNGELDWIFFDKEMEVHGKHVSDNVDTAIYGRVTYQMMASFWPTVPSNPNSSQHELEHADWVEHVSKIVISESLDKAEWNNTTLIKDNIADEISKLKQQPGKDMMIFGSPRLSHNLMQLGLIDEFQLTLNPIVLGSGIPLFKDIKEKFKLKLLSSKPFDSGVIALHYQIESKIN